LSVLFTQELREFAEDSGRHRDVAVTTMIPTGAVNARTMGKNATVANAGASSVSL
jgi:hypothetical protein